MNTTLLEVNITKLNSSTSYTVFVHAVSGNIPGPTRSKSSFTRGFEGLRVYEIVFSSHTLTDTWHCFFNFPVPTPPSNVRITFDSNDSLTLQWDAPDKITKATYIINVTSIWKSSYEEEVKDTTTKNFTGLISGTNYTFEVYTVAGDIRSSPAVCYGFTGESLNLKSFSFKFFISYTFNMTGPFSTFPHRKPLFMNSFSLNMKVILMFAFFK